MTNDNKNYGVLTEQGYPIGQFGYKPLSEQDKKHLEDEEKENKENKK